MARIQAAIPFVESEIHPRQEFLVYTRETWDGEWVLRDYLQPVGPIRYAVQPVGSRATLLYRYGQVREHDQLNFAESWPQDLLGHFVRFDVDSPWYLEPVTLPFYGVIVENDTEVAADWQGTTPVATGDMLYHVVGLEDLLRVPIVSAVAVQGAAEVTLRVHPSFNRRYRRGGTLRGNRTQYERPSGVHAFQHIAEWWNGTWDALDVLRTLLYHHAPTDGGLAWMIAGQTDILYQIQGVWDIPVGTTLLDVLNALIDRRRGLTWIPRTDGEVITLHVASVYDQAISVHGTKLEPNTEVARIEVGTDDAIDDRLVESCTLKRSAAHQVRRFEIVGEPLRTAFTVALADSTLEAGWTAGQESACAAGIADETDPGKQDAFRRKPALRGVFARFRLPAAFDWLAGDGEGGAKAVANPLVKDDGTLDTAQTAPYWNANKALLKWLPLDEPSLEDTDSPAEFSRPFAFVQDPASGRYVLTHDHGIQGIGAAGLRVADHELGIELQVPYAQLFARGHWPDDAAPTRYRGGKTGRGDYFAYSTLGATVCAETDQRARVVVDADEEPAAGVGRTLVVPVRDAHLWYVTPGTVIGIDDDGALVHHDGGTVRDDRDHLLLVAALVKSWYGRPRSALRYVVRELAPVVAPGAMVEALVANAWTEPVGTICTAITWHPERGTTAVETAFWALDFARVALDQVGLARKQALAAELWDLRRALDAITMETD